MSEAVFCVGCGIAGFGRALSYRVFRSTASFQYWRIGAVAKACDHTLQVVCLKNDSQIKKKNAHFAPTGAGASSVYVFVNAARVDYLPLDGALTNKKTPEIIRDFSSERGGTRTLNQWLKRPLLCH